MHATLDQFRRAFSSCLQCCLQCMPTMARCYFTFRRFSENSSDCKCDSWLHRWKFFEKDGGLSCWPHWELRLTLCQSLACFVESVVSVFFRNLSFQRIAYNAVMAAGEDSTKFHWNVAVSLFNDFGSRALIADSTSYNILSSSCGDLAFKCQLGVICAMNLRSIRLSVYTICSINIYIYTHLL